MTRTRINLYQRQYRPALDLLSLSSIVVVWCVLIALCAGSWLIVKQQAASELRTLSAVRDRNAQLEQQRTMLEQQVAAREPAPALAQRVTLLDKSLAKQERLLAELASREALKKQGFASMLTDLATSARDDIWLEAFVISENAMTFKGQLSHPQAMPRWLQALGKTDSFTAVTFDAARVYREDEALYFELITPRDGGDDASRVFPANAGTESE